jgi:hypothetical protein
MVLVVIEAHCAATSEALPLAATRERLDFPKGRVPGHRWTRVFQARDDLTALVFLARPVTPRFFQSLVAFERVNGAGRDAVRSLMTTELNATIADAGATFHRFVGVPTSGEI